MRFRFGEFVLDSSTCIVQRGSEVIELPRRVFECICFLIEQRHRAVGKDELIRVIWHRDNVSDNQLAQLVRSARRLLRDGEGGQRWIRTVPGLGYHWVGSVVPVHEPEHASAVVGTDPLPAQLPMPEPPPPVLAAPMQVRVPTSRTPHERSLLFRLSLTVLLMAMVGIPVWRAMTPARVASPQSRTDSVEREPSDPITALQVQLRGAQFEQVRQGLVNLPLALADTPEAWAISIELDSRRGRYAQALEKLETLLQRADYANDGIWQAQLLSQRTMLYYRMDRPIEEQLASANRALALLETLGQRQQVPESVVAEALRVRAVAYTESGDYARAMADLVQARDLLANDVHAELRANVRGNLARIWAHAGRAAEALNEMEAVIKIYRDSGDRVAELFALITATKIQIELLRWNDARISSDQSWSILKTVPDTDRRMRVVQLRILVMLGQGRLREAQSLREELDESPSSDLVQSLYFIANGQPERALLPSTRAFERDTDGSQGGLLLENREGALLVWTTAAQAAAARGDSSTAPSAAQRLALEAPGSAAGRVARGRWLWMQGDLQAASMEFRRGLDQFRARNQLYSMMQSARPLVELLIERGDLEGADAVLRELIAYDPERVERDYDAVALQLRLALAQQRQRPAGVLAQRLRDLAGERALPDFARREIGPTAVQALTQRDP